VDIVEEAGDGTTPTLMFSHFNLTHAAMAQPMHTRSMTAVARFCRSFAATSALRGEIAWPGDRGWPRRITSFVGQLKQRGYDLAAGRC